MKKIHLAAWALGVMTTAALAQADRLAIRSEPPRDGNIGWHLGSSFPDPGGFTMVEADGTVQVMSVGEAVVATWHFSRGLPARIRGPTLNAQTGEIAIEELHIAHEGLVLGDA